MAKSLGIVTVHGMGTFGVDPPPDNAKPSYSRELFEAVRKEFGPAAFDASVAWREASYSHVFERNQDLYTDELKKVMTIDKLRDLAIRNLGDPASYNSGSDKNKVYPKVHAEIAKALDRVRKQLAERSPIVVLAHSLGGHVVSNHIWDMQRPKVGDPNADIGAIVTFGCNLPLFLFADRPEDIKAIKFPGAKLAAKHKLKTWWRNYYDKDDPLGYPLGPIGKGYGDLVKNGNLIDKPINAGGFLTSWNLFSHVAYWGDSDVAKAVASLMRELTAG
jgi:hypothetical protein